MSDTSEALPQARSGIGLGTILRLIAIALGIMSATLIAVTGFKVPVSPAFLEVLVGVRELVGSIVWPVEKLLVTPVVSWLQERGFAFELREHWKHAFVLLWLVASSVARFGGRREAVFNWGWGGFCALLGGVAAGTVPLSDPGVLYWPLGAFGLTAVGSMLLDSLRFRRPLLIAGAAWTMAIGVTALPVLLALGATLPAPFDLLLPLKMPFQNTPSPGLATLLVLVVAFALMALLTGIADRRGEGRTLWHRFSRDQSTRIGLEMLAVLGGAAFIVWLGNALA